MSGWRGSGGRGCRPLLRKIWQGKPGEKKGRELEGVAESSKGFLDRKRGFKGKGACGHRSSICLLTCPTPPAEGLRPEVHTNPQGRAWPIGAGRQKEETEAVSGVGWRKDMEVSLGRKTDLPAPGESLGPRERAEGDSSAGRKGEQRGARPGIGKGPGGGSHADKHRDKLISSVYPGAGASSPATLPPFLSLAPE